MTKPVTSPVPKSWSIDARHRLKALVRRSLFALSRPWDEASGEVRVAATIMAASSLAMVLGYVMGGRWGLLIAFALALSMSSWALAYSDLRLDRLFRNRELLGTDPWGLLADLQTMCRVDPAVECPRLLVIETDTPLVGSYGLLPYQRTIVVSASILTKFSAEERRVLLANEVQRLRYNQTPMITCVAAWANAVEGFGKLLDATLFAPVRMMTYHRGEFGLRRPVLVGHTLVSPLIGLLNRLLVRRSMIFESDLRAAAMMAEVGLSEISGRRILAEALKRIEHLCEVRPLQMNLSDSALFTVNPLTQFRGVSYFLVQPRTEERIAALRGETHRYESIGESLN